jgi:RNA polymerase sigma-70 factor (ECF subfamily)
VPAHEKGDFHQDGGGPSIAILISAMPSETNLIARAQSGEETALEQLIVRIRPHVERQLMRYPVSDEDRRDLLQMALLQVVRRLGSFRGDSSFSTWLFRVTANEALMLMRSQRRHRARLVEGLDLDDLGSLPPFRGAGDDSQDARARSECETVLRDALAELPEDYRHIVLAHYHDDQGLQEIADELRVTESAVRSRLHRARSRLRAILEHTEVAPSESQQERRGEAA